MSPKRSYATTYTWFKKVEVQLRISYSTCNYVKTFPGMLQSWVYDIHKYRQQTSEYIKQYCKQINLQSL